MARAVIAGAGLAGLLTALKLHDAGYEVTVVEFLERAGGLWALAGFRPERFAGLDVRLGVAALAAQGSCLETEAGRLCGDLAVEAAGFRPATPAELGIFGDRPAGVYSLWTAMRMLERGWLPGERAAVYGCNAWAEGLAGWLRGRGAEAWVFGPSPWCRERAAVLEARGRGGRLARLVTDRGELEADTLVIAEGRPHRWLGAPHAVGNSAVMVDDAAVLERAVELFVEGLEGGHRVWGVGGVEVFPPVAPGEALVKLPAPGMVRACGRTYRGEGPYLFVKVDEDCPVEYVRGA